MKQALKKVSHSLARDVTCNAGNVTKNLWRLIAWEKEKDYKKTVKDKAYGNKEGIYWSS